MPIKLKVLAIALFGLSTLPAQAYIPPDDHYLCDFRQPLEFFVRSRWLPEELPLKVYLPNPPKGTPASHLHLVKQAFNDWAQAQAELTPVYVSQPELAQIKAVWVPIFPESESSWGLALYPGAELMPGARLRHSAQLFLPLRPSSTEPAYDSETFLMLARHAVGHSLGLPHSSSRDDIMSAHLYTLTGVESLSRRDTASLQHLYSLPAQLEIPPCNGDTF